MISAYVDHFCIYGDSEVEKPEIYLLGERHFDGDSEVLNGKLISALADKGPVSVFLEGRLSMRPLLGQERIEARRENYIADHVLEENLLWYGWDMEEAQYREIVQKIVSIRQAKNTALLGIDHMRSPLINFAETLTICRESVIAEVEVATSVGKVRTEAMVNTIKAIKSMQLPGPAVLIAGKAHLIAEETDDPATTAQFDLDPLYEELINHKAIILIPKNILN